MPPRELVPIDTSYREPPTVTLLERSAPVDLEYAEPSPVMGIMSRAWRRMIFLLKAAIVLAVIGTYPAMMFAAHSVDDSEITFAEGYEWSVGDVGKTVTLIARILEGPGWAGDQPKVHPQARLTAMPAWQEAIAGATSDYTRLIAAQTGNEDVAAAARLLAPEPEAMHDRLTAAAEILARYDSNVENGHANAPKGEKALEEKLRLTIGWAEDSRNALAVQSRTPKAWPAAYDDIRTFYAAKARAHVAHELLSAALNEENDAIISRGLTATKAEALSLWRRAAIQKPLFVTNQPGDSAMFGNHLTSMAFLLDEASAATIVLTEALAEPAPKANESRSAELAVASPPSP